MSISLSASRVLSECQITSIEPTERDVILVARPRKINDIRPIQLTESMTDHEYPTISNSNSNRHKHQSRKSTHGTSTRSSNANAIPLSALESSMAEDPGGGGVNGVPSSLRKGIGTSDKNDGNILQRAKLGASAGSNDIVGVGNGHHRIDKQRPSTATMRPSAHQVELYCCFCCCC